MDGSWLQRIDDEPVKRVWYLEVDSIIRREGRSKILWKDVVKKKSSNPL